MNTHIALEENIAEEDSFQLEQLAVLIENECNLVVEVERDKAQSGVRDGGLAIGIAIASLGLAAIQTLISALQYWESQEPKYELSMNTGNQTFLIKNLSKKQIEREIQRIQREVPDLVLEIKISLKDV
jgi:hypothetical protein